MDTSCSYSARIFTQGVFFLVIVSLAAGSEGRSIIVGDSEGWSAGTNYTQWATKNSPFHINDTLGQYRNRKMIGRHTYSADILYTYNFRAQVKKTTESYMCEGCQRIILFKYPLPGNSTIAQSVYMLPNLWSYTTCEFRGAKLLGSAAQGAGEGLKVELNQSRPFYFASAEGNAYDCIAGLTKFIAVPSSTH